MTWQSQYWIVSDVNNLMAGNFSKVVWFEFANREWSLNGWRWLTYINAMFFSWNTAYELLLYAFTIFGIFLLIFKSVTEKFSEWRWRQVILILVTLITLFSFAGAGARGMELGTYIGIFFTVLLFKVSLSDSSNKIVSALLPPAIIFIFSGGYALSTTITLILVSTIVQLYFKGFDHFPNLKISTFSSLVSLGLYIIVFLSHKQQGPSTLKIFYDYLQMNPFYPIKFLFYSSQGGLITIQNVEGLTSREFSLVTFLLSAFLLLLNFFCLLYSFKYLRKTMLIPLSLLFYSIGTSLTIMVTRPTGDFGMLSPWYSLHLKLGIVGCLWLLFIFVSTPDLNFSRLNWTVNITVFLLIPVLLFANFSQWKRQPYERAYFQEIKKVTLFPETMAGDSNGLTPLKIGLSDSQFAIAVLKRHKIGVYRDAGAARAEFMGENAFLRLGENFSDGWVGRSPRYLFQKGVCKLIQFELLNLPKIRNNEATVKVDGKQIKVFQVTETPYILRVPDAGQVTSVEFSFSKSLIPAKNQLGEDLRDLSANIQVRCEK